MNVNRREFLQWGGMALAGAAFSTSETACTPSKPRPDSNIPRGDHETADDIIKREFPDVPVIDVSLSEKVLKFPNPNTAARSWIFNGYINPTDSRQAEYVIVTDLRHNPEDNLASWRGVVVDGQGRQLKIMGVRSNKASELPGTTYATTWVNHVLDDRLAITIDVTGYDPIISHSIMIYLQNIYPDTRQLIPNSKKAFKLVDSSVRA